MPLYEYQCKLCEERLEAIQKFSDPLYTQCPKCGGELKKLISSSAIQFKGSGFYITDYARSGSSSGEGGKGESGKGESGKGESGGSESGKGESKSESGKSGSETSSKKKSD